MTLAELHKFVLLFLWAFVAGKELQANSTPPSNNGDVSFDWTSPAEGSQNSLGAVVLRAAKGGDSVYLNLRVTPAGPPLNYQGMESAAGEWKLRFTAGERAVVIVLRPERRADRFAFDISAADLSVAALSVADWPQELRDAAISVPYYSGRIVYWQPLEVFGSVYFDWQNSNASKFDRGAAVYGKLTSGARNALHERIIVSASRRIAAVFPEIPNPKSPYMGELAGRTVIDISGAGSFAEIEAALKRLGEHGLRNCIAIIHDWQRDGYDNGLPDHYPANSKKGGDAGLRNVVAAAQELGCLTALHENYVDYYPNSDHFTLDAVALTGDGKPQNAWLNRTTHIQSYATKAAWFLKNAATQAPEIHRRYGTSASFIDVNSAVLPWWRADMDATTGGAGTFAAMDAGSIDLWKFERRVHEGPVLGEGLNHWYWSGLLDGVEAQFGAGGTASEGPAAPLFADFDLLRIHPLQINQGMGFYERWATGGQDLHQKDVADAYRMQEIAFGHSPYIGGDAWRDAPRVIEEQNLVSPVARRYATQTAVSIEYEVAGAWTGVEGAIKARDWSRIQVRYTNGDTIVANARRDSLHLAGYELPQYGWLARGAGLLAYTAVRRGQTVDYAETAGSFFANARGSAAEPKVIDFGVIRTNGTASLARQDRMWILRVLPGNREVTVELDGRRFGRVAKSTCAATGEAAGPPSMRGEFWAFQANGLVLCSWPAE